MLTRVNSCNCSSKEARCEIFIRNKYLKETFQQLHCVVLAITARAALSEKLLSASLVDVNKKVVRIQTVDVCRFL